MYTDKSTIVKYLPLFHHFKAIYQFPKHIIFWVKIVANAPLNVYKGIRIKPTTHWLSKSLFCCSDYTCFPYEFKYSHLLDTVVC
jgi:hypothetical protein